MAEVALILVLIRLRMLVARSTVTHRWFELELIGLLTLFYNSRIAMANSIVRLGLSAKCPATKQCCSRCLDQRAADRGNYKAVKNCQRNANVVH